MGRIFEVIGILFNTKRNILVTCIVISIIAVFIVFISPGMGDYRAYQDQWQFFLDGGNPWNFGIANSRDFNAYGPLHNIMAYFYAVNPKFPKFIQVLSALLATFYLLRLAGNSNLENIDKLKLEIFLILNPLLWIFFIYLGFHDALIGSLFLFGIVAYDNKRFITSSLLLGAVTLYKFIPIFILPFLCLKSRKLNWRFSLSIFAFLTLGFGISYWTWGKRIFDPILFGAKRVSQSASIFRIIRGEFKPLHFLGIDNLDYLSIYLVLFSLFVIFAFYLVYKIELRQVIILSISFVLLFYKINHIQFYFSLMLLLVYFLIKEYKIIKELSPNLLTCIKCFLLWLSFLVVMWACAGARREFFHSIIGLPTFIIHLWMNIALIVFIVRSYKALKLF